MALHGGSSSNTSNDVSGHVVGGTSGVVHGHISGHVTNDTSGVVHGRVSGHVNGRVSGYVNGRVSGYIKGRISGYVDGHISKNTSSDVNTIKHEAIPDDVFFNVPIEVRDVIYDLTLTVDAEIIPYPGPWESKLVLPAHFSLNLLLVCKRMTEEARMVLYGKNQWRLPAVMSHQRPTNYDCVFTRHPLLFHDVTAFFDSRDLSNQERIEQAISIQSRPDSSFRVKNIPAAKARAVHSCHLWSISMVWHNKQALVLKMRNLQSLLLNVEYLLCPGGCCRYKVLKDAFYWYVLKDILHQKCSVYYDWKPSKIEIVGLVSHEERVLVHDEFGFPRVEEVVEEAAKGQNSEVVT